MESGTRNISSFLKCTLNFDVLLKVCSYLSLAFGLILCRLQQVVYHSYKTPLTYLFNFCYKRILESTFWLHCTLKLYSALKNKFSEFSAAGSSSVEGNIVLAPSLSVSLGHVTDININVDINFCVHVIAAVDS